MIPSSLRWDQADRKQTIVLKAEPSNGFTKSQRKLRKPPPSFTSEWLPSHSEVTCCPLHDVDEHVSAATCTRTSVLFACKAIWSAAERLGQLWAILIYGQPYAPVPYGRFPTNLTVDLRHHQDHSAPGASSGSSLLLMSVTSPHPALVPFRHVTHLVPLTSPYLVPLQLNNILFYRNIFICYKSYTNTNIN